VVAGVVVVVLATAVVEVGVLLVVVAVELLVELVFTLLEAESIELLDTVAVLDVVKLVASDVLELV
jgi:hypothetical protein